MTRRNSMRQSDELEVYDSPATIGFAHETLRIPKSIVEPAKPEEKISVFWRVFGGTILSITALIAIQAYQAQSSNIHELRADQTRLREMAADFIKKDELTSRTSSLWNRMQELQSLSSNVTVAGTKVAALETQAALAEKERKEMSQTITQLAAQRDKVGQIDDVKKHVEQDHKDLLAMTAIIQTLKDKDCALEKKLVESESDRKDLVREIQKLRERLAKLEGQSQPATSTTGKGDTRIDDRN